MGNRIHLIDLINESILERKGKEIVQIDLTGLSYAACDHFIICHGDSVTQVRALADGIEEKLESRLKVRVFHKEGIVNAQWVLLDYGIAVVHVFLKESRDYYKLEDLWGDGKITVIREE